MDISVQYVGRYATSIDKIEYHVSTMSQAMHQQTRTQVLF